MKLQLILAAILLCASSVYAITIETVPIGDIGNPNDYWTGNRLGGVNYAYNMGKYEVTVGQFTAFLNAVAKEDTYNLYTTEMMNYSPVPSIARTGSSPNYVYSVIGSPNHPASFIMWSAAARFCNWLHNGQPTGAQGDSTTERGAYTIDGATGLSVATVKRNPNAKWFIPTENEWYKAAYYQPTAKGGDVDGYWSFPMRTNDLPFSDQPPGVTPDNTRVGNFFRDDRIANGYDDGYAVTGQVPFQAHTDYLSDVGAYSSSSSYYGTFDQGGNIIEWVEDREQGYRTLRGGGWVTEVYSLSSLLQGHAGIENGYPRDIGFRVAYIPEPNTIALLTIASVGFCTRRRKSIAQDCA